MKREKSVRERDFKMVKKMQGKENQFMTHRA